MPSTLGRQLYGPSEFVGCLLLVSGSARFESLLDRLSQFGLVCVVGNVVAHRGEETCFVRPGRLHQSLGVLAAPDHKADPGRQHLGVQRAGRHVDADVVLPGLCRPRTCRDLDRAGIDDEGMGREVFDGR